MASVIEICNNALLDLGEDPITALTEGSQAARLCNQRWPAVRDAVLRAHPWNCAMELAELSVNATAPTFKWDYSYNLPANFLRLAGVFDSSENLITDYEVVGKKILINATAPIYIGYVKRETDPTKYDALLVEALSARLSAAIAYSLTGSTTLVEAMWTLYQNKMIEARGMDAREGTSEVVITSDWLQAKLGRRGVAQSVNVTVT
jgi:hypothetical protein